MVTVEHKPKGGGTLQVRYRTLEQLDDVVRRLETAPKAPERDWDPATPRLRKV